MLKGDSVLTKINFLTRNDLKLTSKNDYIRVFLLKSADKVPVSKWFGYQHKEFLKVSAQD